MNRLLLVIGLLAITTPLAMGQYQGDRPQAKSFEYSTLFFTPSAMDPLGPAGFKGIFPGLMDDQLLDAALNPALLARDPDAGSLLYLDFRNAREMESNVTYGMPHYRVHGISRTWHPWYQPQSRKALEPLISTAFAGRPFGDRVPRLRLGGDYQLILNTQQYYPVPQDIYRFVAGTSSDGVRMAGAEDMEIRDRFTGSDDMMQEGHLAGLNLALDLGSFALGTRVAFATFTLDGSQGTSNLWQNTMDYSSFWATMEARDQEYHHWDLSAGLVWKPDNAQHTGIRLGWLTGDADQQAIRQDDSESLRGTVGMGDSWNYYFSEHRRDQNWNLSGETWYGNWHLKRAFSDDLTLLTRARFQYQQQDLLMDSFINQESEGDSRWTWSNDQRDYRSESFVRDERSGLGERTMNQANLQASVLWQLNEVSRFSIGAGFQRRHLKTETTERVSAESFNLFEMESTSGNNDYLNIREVLEEKEIIWDFDARIRSFYFPVWYERTFSSVWEGMIGLNRSLVIYNIEDETLILYDFKEEYDGNRREREENFGERVRLPDEKESETRYELLGMLTVRPAERLQLRFLIVPEIEHIESDTKVNHFQFWMSMQLGF